MVLWLCALAVVVATRISDDLISCNLRWANDFRQVHHVAFLQSEGVAWDVASLHAVLMVVLYVV